MTRPAILDRVQAAGYAVFSAGDYDLNLIGVRTSQRISNLFDDEFHICYLEQGQWQHHKFACTTDPGTYWIENPGRVAGTAILKAGQWRGCWTLGKHKGYEALQQIKPVTVWRDANRDMQIDHDSSQTGVFGINIHKANSNPAAISMRVNKWSAGCTVIQDPNDFKKLIHLCKKQIAQWNWNTFTYTLLED